MLFGPAGRAFVQLNVAAAGTAATQIAPGVIAVGDGDVEYVVAAGFAIVGRNDGAGASTAADIDVVIDFARGGVDHGVADDGGGTDMHSGAMIDIVQVAP